MYTYLTHEMAQRAAVAYNEVARILREGGHQVETREFSVHYGNPRAGYSQSQAEAEKEPVKCEQVTILNGKPVRLGFDLRRSSRPGGQLQCQIGWRPIQTFPEPKDGFDCAKLAQELVALVERDKKEQEAFNRNNERLLADRTLAEATKERIKAVHDNEGLPYEERISSDVTVSHGDVTLRLSNITPDEAVALVAKLKELRSK